MDYCIEFEQEDDGRWIAEISSLPGVLVNGTTTAKALREVLQLAGQACG